MFVMYFTEQPMSTYPADIGLEVGHTALMFSNKYFDPVAGSRLYNEYIEHYIYAEEQGVEGFMLNEHHNAVFSAERETVSNYCTSTDIYVVTHTNEVTFDSGLGRVVFSS
jgi:hypothetical protein